MFFFELLLSVIAQVAAACEDLSPSVRIADLEHHYARVEHELRSMPPAGLDAAQRAERERVIALLQRYRLARDFGIQPSSASERTFSFIDDGGRRCAVAYLLDATGSPGLTCAVAESRNGALVAELAGEAQLAAWLELHGMTLWEAARIQGPHREPTPLGPPRTAYDLRSSFSPGSLSRGGSGRFVPGDARRPAVAGVRDEGRPSAPRTGPITGAPGGGGSPGAFRHPGLAVGSAVDWLVWWRWNRSRLLDAPELAHATAARASLGATSVQDDGGQDALVDLRSRLAGTARGLLRHADADVRRSAAFALGLCGGADDVELLLACREDAYLDVREEALLALGALPSARAQHALLRLATSATQGNAQDRAFAILALASSRRGKQSSAMDAPIAELLVSNQDGAIVEEALALAQVLAPLPGVELWLREQLENEKAPLLLRCRAAEALGSSEDGVTLAALLRGLGARHPDLRASAAIALAEFEHTLVVPSLLTAYEVEREQRVRGLLLIAAGSRGGAHAQSFLLEQLRSGPKSLRPWAALGLGLLARESTCTNEISTALRTATAEEANREARSAHLLARGLARDEDVVEAVDAELREKPSAEARVLACAALAACGNDAARERLRRAVEADPCPTTQQLLAVELAEIAAAEDGPRLRQILSEVLDPAIRVSLTRAFGRSADRATSGALVDALEGGKLEPRALSGCLEAAAWSVATDELPVGYRWTARTSADLFPSWARVAIHRVL